MIHSVFGFLNYNNLIKMNENVENTSNIIRKNVKARKVRFSFTIDKDIRLLKAALFKNPWQTGAQNWEEIKNLLEIEYNAHLTKRTVEDRVNLLLHNYKSQQLKSKTGTEEQETERGRLLAEIESIVDEEKAASEINMFTAADEDDDMNLSNEPVSHDPFATNESADRHEPPATNETVDRIDEPVTNSKKKRIDERKEADAEVSHVEPVINSKKKRIEERKQADAERQKYIDEADGPMTRKSKGRLSLEDEMILKRQEHEMKVEIEKINVEKERLEIERRREARLEEEGQRRDQYSLSQILIQQSMIALLQKCLEK